MMYNYNKCDKCVTPVFLGEKECKECKDNPIYANVPVFSKFRNYMPTCPRGYDDCVNDPAYIKFYHPKWYEALYGDKTPIQAAASCREAVKEDPDMEYYCYDDEDK